MGEIKELKSHVEPDQIHLDSLYDEDAIQSHTKWPPLERKREIERLLRSPDYRLNLVYGTDRAEDKRQERLNHFVSLLSEIYPASYEKKIFDLLYRDWLGNERNRQLPDLLRIPLITEIKFDPVKAHNFVESIASTNPSVRNLCEAVVGHFQRLSELGEITLKDLETKEELKDITSQAFLLVGEKGSGKSWIGRVLADILGVPCIFVDCANVDYLKLVGSSPQWGNSEIGILAKRLIDEGRFPPIVIFDEIEKSGHSNEHRLIDCINHIIDPLKPVTDEFLEIPLLHYKLAVFILTANDITNLPPHLKSRTVIYEITPIDPEVRYQLLIEELSTKIKQLNLSIEEIELLHNDNNIRNKIISIISSKNLDLRELSQRLRVAINRYIFLKRINKTETIRLIDLFLDELGRIPHFTQQTDQNKPRKVGFVH